MFITVIFFTLGLIGFFLTDPSSLGICHPDSISCDNFYGEGIGFPMMMVGTSIFIVSLLLYLFRELIFKSWLKFTYWYIPIAAIFIILSPVDGGGSFLPIGADKELSSWFFSVLFLIISVVIIIVKSVKLKKNSKNSI